MKINALIPNFNNYSQIPQVHKNGTNTASQGKVVFGGDGGNGGYEAILLREQIDKLNIELKTAQAEGNNDEIRRIKQELWEKKQNLQSCFADTSDYPTSEWGEP